MNVLDTFRLDGKCALVTAGAGKYGSQMVIALAEAGAVVVTASRSLDKNVSFASKLQAEGLKVYADAFDQSDEQSVNALRDRMIEKYGHVDILVNNSVFRPTNKSLNESGFFEESLAVNGSGLFYITRAFGDHMAKNRHGSIINIGSYMGELGPDENLYEGIDGMNGFDSPDYFFHKAGMHNLTRFMAAYYGPHGVRVNCLSLGGLFNHQPPKFVERYEKRTFLHRMANDTDVKGMIVYLASDASLYTTATVIPIDGGYSAK